MSFVQNPAIIFSIFFGRGGGAGKWGGREAFLTKYFFSRPYTTDMYRQYAPCPYNPLKLK